MIPRKFHWVWVSPSGYDSPPPDQVKMMTSWLNLNEGWRWKLHTHPQEMDDPRMQADILRYRILASEGGVALDTDFQALRPLRELLMPLRAFSALQKPSHVAIGVMGCEPGHPFFVDMASEAESARFTAGKASSLTGPGLMTRTWARRGDLTLFPAEFFYPYTWDQEFEMEEALDRDDADMRAAWRYAYGVHHWAHARKHFLGSKGADGA